MLEKLLDDDYDDDAGSSYPSDLLAVGRYESRSDVILKGFKVFQKKYVYKNTALYLLLVLFAIASQVISIMYDSGDPMFSAGLIVFCVCIGVWIAMRPHNTFKSLAKSIENLNGSIYEAEIYTDKIKISTIYDAPVENAPDDDEENAGGEEGSPGDGDGDEVIPATVIHLNNEAVEMVECEDMFIIYVKKVNIFVVPKSAFKKEDIGNISKRLSNLMGVRYKEG